METALRKKPEDRLNRDLQAISSWLGQQVLVVEMRATKKDSGGGGGGDRSSTRFFFFIELSCRQGMSVL